MLRQSRRTRGLQLEEQKPLEVIEKETRVRRAVAREEKKAAESKDARTQPDSEEEIQEAQHVSLDGTADDGQEESAPVGSGADFNSDSSVEVLGVSGPDVPEQASVGGAVKVDALEEKTTPGETATIKLEGPLSTVKEEAASDVLGDDSQSGLETSISSSSCVQVPNEETTSRMQIPSSAQETVDLTAVDDAGAPEDSVIPNLVKLYCVGASFSVIRDVSNDRVRLASPRAQLSGVVWNRHGNVGVFGVADVIGGPSAYLDLRMETCQIGP
ncbi:hypothetical protein PHMEG_00033356 [Phytophthora megakarya]|uniref:Uncharacterized protein n=1 Tax=Phytophthora megakarya TaxID=4795 RepID=A0A225UT67_9STRA|nr:hypothetical protein PHMEG_00033356 [Phytophthora megakarya]